MPFCASEAEFVDKLQNDFLCFICFSILQMFSCRVADRFQQQQCFFFVVVVCLVVALLLTDVTDLPSRRRDEATSNEEEAQERMSQSGEGKRKC